MMRTRFLLTICFLLSGLFPRLSYAQPLLIKDSMKRGENLFFLVNGVHFEMIFVEGGTFQMGETPEQENAFRTNTDSLQMVTLGDYYIGKYELTQALWIAVMGSNPSRFKGDDLPVTNVRFEDCEHFVEKLNALTGLCFQLPTEARWEYAARGGNKSRAYLYSGSNDIDEVAWNYNNSEYKTHAVGLKKANELGIYDMTGNVWEICCRWLVAESFIELESTKNYYPTHIKVGRGGGLLTTPTDCRIAYRSLYIEGSGSAFGFRLCLEP